MQKKKVILLIEDNFDVRENTAEILELANYEVVTAENGKVGVMKAKEFLPDLIVCDIMMPQLDGYGVLHILSKDVATSHIPFIFLTAKAEKLDFRKGMNLGADDYLTKPFEEIDLLDTIRHRLQKVEALQAKFEPTTAGFSGFINMAKAVHDLNELSESYEVSVYRAKHILFLEESYPRYLYLLNEGKVKTYRSNEEGKELITNIYKAGDFIGYQTLFEAERYHETAMTLEDSLVTLIPKQDFFELIYNNRDVAYRFIKMLAKDVEEKEQRLIHLAYDSVRKRLANALLILCKKQEEWNKNGNNRISLDISREDLANLVGTSKETVIRALSDFKSEKIIVTKGKYITIINIKAIEALV